MDVGRIEFQVAEKFAPISPANVARSQAGLPEHSPDPTLSIDDAIRRIVREELAAWQRELSRSLFAVVVTEDDALPVIPQ